MEKMPLAPVSRAAKTEDGVSIPEKVRGESKWAGSVSSTWRGRISPTIGATVIIGTENNSGKAFRADVTGQRCERGRGLLRVSEHVFHLLFPSRTNDRGKKRRGA